MKSTPKKHKPLRHGATSFTGNRRRRRMRPQETEFGSPDSTSKPATASSESEDARDDQRLQKVLAAAGVGSRRECEELILEGRIEVDGEPVTQLGVRVDSRKQKITVDGEQVKFQRRTYFAVNKPTGVLSTNRDPSGRIRVVDLVGGEKRLFTVGRLDQHSDGLIIVTNDGELTQRLTHPKYGVPKVYLVQVAGEATGEVIAKLLAGVHLEEGIAKAARASIRKRAKSHTLLEMTLTEGRNREIRRMLAQLGHKVQRLTRIAVGPVRLGKLKPGQFRPLESQEVKELKGLAFAPVGSAVEAEPRASRPRREEFKPRREPSGGARPATFAGTRTPHGGVRSGKPGKFDQQKSGQKTSGERKFGKKRFAGKKRAERKIGEKKSAEKKFGGRAGKPPRWSQETRATPPQKSAGNAHPLPFLKQGLVDDEGGPAAAAPPIRSGKPARRKPLRRLRVRST
jgi:23S rRNA pseudouridine2605 synthase